MRKPLVLSLALAISGSAFADTCMVSPTAKEQVSGRFGKFREGGAANFGSGNAKPHMHDGLDFSTGAQPGQVVATAFYKHDVGVGELAQHAVDGFEVDGAILADGGVGAAAGFHAQDALRRKRAADGEQALVFLGVDVVGDGHQVVLVAHGLAQHFQ